jgi:hypothetical protein
LGTIGYEQYLITRNTEKEVRKAILSLLTHSKEFSIKANVFYVNDFKESRIKAIKRLKKPLTESFPVFPNYGYLSLTFGDNRYTSIEELPSI